MDKWGFFRADNPVNNSEKFSEYGITCKFYGNTTSPSFTFSDGTASGRCDAASTPRYWLVNDEKHICIQTPNKSLPYKSEDNYIDFFTAGVWPLINGEILTLSAGSSGGVLYGFANIPNVTVTDPSATDLILVQALAAPRGGSNYYFFKDLYFCYQRQFNPGDIVISADGQKYISAGGWMLFKM